MVVRSSGYVTSTGIDGRGFWYEGRFYPIIAGGNGEDDAGGDDGGDVDDGGSDADSNDDAPPPKPSALSLTTRQLNDRLERARRAERARLARDAGFGDDVDGYVKSVGEFRQQRETQRGELETLRSRNTELLGENNKLKSKLKSVSLGAAVESAATAMGFADPSDAYRLADFGDVQDDEGEVDRDAVKAILSTLSKNKPYLLKSGSSNADSRTDNSRQGIRSPNPGKASQQADPNKDSEIARRFNLGQFQSSAPRRTDTQ